jgi:hypothetical protein
MSTSFGLIGMSSSTKSKHNPNVTLQSLYVDPVSTISGKKALKTIMNGPIVNKYISPEVRSILNIQPREYYAKANQLMAKTSNCDERLEVALQLLTSFVTQSMLLYKLNNDYKIITYIKDMDMYWHQFCDKNKNNTIIESENTVAYLDDMWYRQGLANEIGVNVTQALKAYAIMGWGDFNEYIVKEDNDDVLYL